MFQGLQPQVFDASRDHPAQQLGRAHAPEYASRLAALQEFNLAYVAYGSWLCENSSARRARRNNSKKLRTMESNRAARTMFDTLSENCIFYISRMYEFLHNQGQTRT
jgi:hypothetical protein